MSTLPESALDIRTAVAAGTVSAVEICRAHLDRIAAANPALNAFNTVCADRALAAAAVVDADRAAGKPLGPLAGVPVALKDNLCTNGLRTTASSKILDRFIPPYDATVTTRLEAAGAVVVDVDQGHDAAKGAAGGAGPANQLQRGPALELHAHGSADGDQGRVVAVDPELYRS